MNNNHWTATELILHSHPSLQLSDNFVLKAQLNRDQLAFVLGQYSWLPKVIVQFLSKGIERLKQFPAIHAELKRNRAEELGSRTFGKVHYNILCAALQNEVGLNIATQNLPCIPATKTFLETISEILENGNQANVAGAIYALESSAVPELLVVAAVINCYQPNTINLQHMQTAGSIRKVKGSANYTLNDFFVLHIQDFEKGHESGLRKAVTKDFANEHWYDFNESFETVLNAMDAWWLSLSKIPLPVGL